MSPPRLRVSTISGRVVVVAEVRDDVSVEPDGTQERGEDGSIEVKPHKRSSPVHVRCPEGSEVMVGTVSGDVDLQGSLGAVRVTSTSGSITVDTVESADLRTLSGRATVEQCSGLCRASTKSGRIDVGATGGGDLATVSGNVRIGATSGVEVRTVSGKVAIQSGAQGPVRAKTISGSIDVTLPHGVRPHIRAAGRGKVRGECEEGNDVEIDVRTVSGKIEIAPR
jgi:DUF4097 and DUF4098 domain-containing protein YvlB